MPLRSSHDALTYHPLEVHVHARQVHGVILVQAGALVDRPLETLTTARL